MGSGRVGFCGGLGMSVSCVLGGGWLVLLGCSSGEVNTTNPNYHR